MWQHDETADRLTRPMDQASPEQDGWRRPLRIMLAEDESLIAIMMEEAVARMGHTVVGPLANVEAALAAATAEEIDLALLDVNLDGKLIFGVADVLRQRAIPVVLLTGYGLESIPPEFRDVPTLQKPIEPELLRRSIAALALTSTSPRLATAAGIAVSAAAGSSARLTG
jgi:DNA-binding response OmpR family regulator